MDMDTLSNTVKETAKSLVSSKSKDRVDTEYELIQTKQDAIIENAEIVTYKLLMKISQKVGLLDYSTLKLRDKLRAELQF